MTITPELEQQIRIVIAEKCLPPWKQLQKTVTGWFILVEGKGWIDMPNYPRSLDAMHEAEKVLDTNQMCEYVNQLDSICVLVHICHYTHAMAVLSATALQRAEAFCRTVKPEMFE